MGQIVNPPAGSTAGTGASSGATSTQVVIACTDAFNQNDAVFLDYQSNTINNLTGQVVANALTAGPAGIGFSTGQAGITSASGNIVELTDGTFVVAAVSNASTNTYMMTATRYDAQGNILARNILESATAANTAIGSVNLTVLSNGNIAVTYLHNSSTGKWKILSQTMQVLFAGMATGPSIYYVQELINGRFFLINSSGIDTVSATGVMTNIAITSVGQQGVAIQAELNDDQEKQYNSRNITLENYAPIRISAGGYGLIIGSSTGVSYVQLNADGTQRGSTSVLATYGSQGVTSVTAALSSTGNICWAVSLTSNVGSYGVVADNGSIVKASTALTSVLTGGGKVKILPDAVGDFVILGTDTTPQWNILYITSAGVPKATFPKVLTSTTGNGDEKVVKLSTGIVFINCPTIYNFKSILILTDGTISEQQATWLFGSGNSGGKVATFVYNDTVYGACTTGAGGNCDFAVFTISNAGVVDASAQFTGVTLPITSPIAIMLDTSQNYFNVAGSGIIATFGMDKRAIQTYGAGTSGAKYKAKKHSIWMHGQANTVTNYKIKSTVLLGVAASAAAAGGLLVVNTKGIFPTTFKANKAFTHAANNPPGNAGWISNGIISLTGV